MNIAIFHNLPPGGAKRTLNEQIIGLSKNNKIDIYKIDPSIDKKLKRYVNKIYKYEFSLDSKLPGIFNRLEKDFNNFIKLRLLHKIIAKDIDQKKYDVVLVHTDKYTESPCILRYLKTASVYHCHELLRIAYEKELEFKENVPIYKKYYENLTRKIRKEIDKKNAQGASKIITSSKYIQRKVKLAYKRNAILCYPGVDCKVFKPYLKAKFNKILFVGGKGKLKGFSLAKKSLGLLKPEIRPNLVILGFAPNEKLIKNDSKLAECYSKSLMTLCTSYNEPLGLVALESMACGTPVLAVNEGGYKETIINAKTGYLLERNPKEFSNKIEFLIKNPKVLQEMSEYARDYIVKNWQWKNHIKKVEKVLAKAIKARVY